jgi:hypothetical protein
MARDGLIEEQETGSGTTITSDLIPFYNAFRDLDTERPGGMTILPIPWSAIVFYAEYNEMDVAETVFFVRRMDEAFIERVTNADSSGFGKTVQRPARPD